MATYTKETALYDTGAIADDIGAAGETASKYITTVDGGGIKVHPENNTTDYVQIDGDSLDIYSGGQEVASYGTASRIGMKSGAHIDISGQSIAAVSSSGNEYFNISESGGSYTDIVFVQALSVALTSTSTIDSTYSFGGDGASKWNSLSTDDLFYVRFIPTFEYTESGRKKRIELPEVHSGQGFKGRSKTLYSWTYGNAQVVQLIYTGSTTSSNVLRLVIHPTTTVNGVTYTLKQLKIKLGVEETIIAPLYRFGTEMPENGGAYSFLMGKGTIAPNAFQLVIGQYNDANLDPDAVFIVGNGTSDVEEDRSNAFWINPILGTTSAAGDDGEIRLKGTGPEIGIDIMPASSPALYVGSRSGGNNHGLYSRALGKWIAYSNGTNVGLGGTIFKDLFVLETHAYKTNNLSITSGSSLNGTLDITKSGYVPVAISGWRSSNGDNGSGGSRINPFTLRLSASSVGSGTVQIGLSAIGGAVTKCSFTVDVLWIKNI